MASKLSNEWDRLLSEELRKPKQSKDLITTYVENGADISEGFLYWLILFDVVCPYIPDTEYKTVSVQTVKLLIELGADVKWHDDDKTDCLLPAIWCGIPELIELVLARGAAPNGMQEGESILDCAYDEKFWVSLEYPDGNDAMQKIVEIMERYGAKLTYELMKNKPD